MDGERIWMGKGEALWAGETARERRCNRNPLIPSDNSYYCCITIIYHSSDCTKLRQVTTTTLLIEANESLKDHRHQLSGPLHLPRILGFILLHGSMTPPPASRLIFFSLRSSCLPMPCSLGARGEKRKEKREKKKEKGKRINITLSLRLEESANS